MRRKVIQLAGRTLVVSLPNKWVRQHNVRKGDEVEVVENNRELRLTTYSEAGPERVEVRVNDKHPFLRRLVDNPYRQGYDEVTFHYDNPETFEKIQDEVGNLMGFEIIKQGSNFCIMKNLAVGLDDQFESILNRLMMITFSMAEELARALEDGQFQELKKIEKMEDTTNKFAHFCKRILNTKGYKEPMRVTQLYRTACLFEEISDELRDICRIQDKRRPSKATIKSMWDTHSQMKTYYKLFNKHDTEQLLAFGKRCNEIENECIRNINESKDALLNHYILTILGKMKHLTEDLG